MLYAYLIVLQSWLKYLLKILLQSDTINVLLGRKLFSPYLLSILTKMVVLRAWKVFQLSLSGLLNFFRRSLRKVDFIEIKKKKHIFFSEDGFKRNISTLISEQKRDRKLAAEINKTTRGKASCTEYDRGSKI